MRGAGWSSLVARRAHNPKVVGSNPASASMVKRPFGGAFPFNGRFGALRNRLRLGDFSIPLSPFSRFTPNIRSALAAREVRDAPRPVALLPISSRHHVACSLLGGFFDPPLSLRSIHPKRSLRSGCARSARRSSTGRFAPHLVASPRRLLKRGRFGSLRNPPTSFGSAEPRGSSTTGWMRRRGRPRSRLLLGTSVRGGGTARAVRGR